MKKIKHSINQKDRIVCVALPGKLEFYYQTFGNGKRMALFKGENDKAIPFSGSVFKFFRENGRCFDGHSGFSLTLKELYSTKRSYYRNPKIAKVLDRIPRQIDAVLRTSLQAPKADKKYKRIELVSFDEFEIAA